MEAKRASADERLVGDDSISVLAWDILDSVSDERSTLSSSWPPSAFPDGMVEMCFYSWGFLYLFVLMYTVLFVALGL